MNQTALELRRVVEQAIVQLSKITEVESQQRPAAEKWSRKEILGHLIDSASNNHQRFVRAQLEKNLTFPGYAQDGWTRAQRYEAAEWVNLVDLWASYNRHLAHVMSAIPEEKGDTPCTIGSGEPVTLSFLVTDYLSHLNHHLKQIL